MKLTAQELKKQFQIVSPSIPKKTPMPILEHYYFTNSADESILLGSDLAHSIRNKGKQVSEENFELCVPKLFYDLVNLLPNQEKVSFEVTEKGKLILKTQNGKYQFPTLPKDEYPEVEKFQQSEQARIIDVQSQVLINMVKFVSFAILKTDDDFIPRNNSFFFEVSNNVLSVTGSEGTLLAHIETEIDYKGEPFKALLHKDTIQRAVKLLEAEGSTEAKMIFDKSQFSLKTERTELFSKTLGEKYPEYRAIIPPSDNWIEINAREITQQLRICKEIDSAEVLTRLCRLTYNPDEPEKCKITIEYKDETISEQTIQVISHSEEVKKLDKNFLIQILQKPFASAESETVRLYWSEKSRPILITNSKSPEKKWALCMEFSKNTKQG